MQITSNLVEHFWLCSVLVRDCRLRAEPWRVRKE